MSAIDWSKAPADATHFSPADGYFVDLWAKKDGDSWMYCAMLDGSSWHHGGNPPKGVTYIERPAIWTGEGLPPVGMVCERMWASGPASYVRVRVIAHDEGQAVYRFLEERRKGEVQASKPGDGDSCGNPIFRPARTAEQIAAEKRESGIRAMQACLGGGSSSTRLLIERLYDAGCRKQEQK